MPYTEYVRHCLRFYTRHPNPTFKSEVDEQNWRACDLALQKYSGSIREAFLSIYSSLDVIDNVVYHIALSNHITPGSLWRQVRDLERKVAEKRGLI